MTITETLSNVAVTAMVATMIPDNDNKKQPYTLVVGLGKTGLSIVHYLKSLGENVVVVDSREHPPGLEEVQNSYPDVRVIPGSFDRSVFVGASKLIISPGVAMTESAVQDAIAQDIDVIGDIELFAQQVESPVIAITGSNGKSTVTTLVGEMAKKASLNVAVGGNLGVPALELLQQDADLYVLELSSFQLETLRSLRPVSACVLNVSADHMDRYTDLEHYTRVKENIYNHCKVAVINRDDDAVKKMTPEHQFISGFSLGEPAMGDFGLREYDGELWLCKGREKLVAEHDLKIGGRHNTANALAALALGEAANIPMEDMLASLIEFKGLPHRTQWVRETEGVNWYNDSKGTNVGATIAAIEGMQVSNRLILIAGGLAKDADFSGLKEVVKDKVRLVVLIGRDAPKIEQALDKVVPVLYAKDMQDAVNISANHACQGDVVLLSPACASFDMFNGFEHRGEVFMAAVEAL